MLTCAPAPRASLFGQCIRVTAAWADFPFTGPRGSRQAFDIYKMPCNQEKFHSPTSEPCPEAFVMPSHSFLQALGRLNRSSSRFHDKLTNALYGEEYKGCVPGLQDDDLVWLVDYLDKVRHPVGLPQSPLKPV